MTRTARTGRGGHAGPTDPPARTAGPTGWTCQYGLEENLDDYVTRLVAVFDAARRVLVETGTCWLNLGDSYSSGTTAGERAPSPVPAKNLNGMPWKVAFTLQTAGWTLRNAVWAKIVQTTQVVAFSSSLGAKNHLPPSCWCCS